MKRLDPRALAYPWTVGFLLSLLVFILFLAGGFVITFGIPFAHNAPDDLIGVIFDLLLTLAALVTVYAVACLLAGTVRFAHSWRANSASRDWPARGETEDQ